MLKVNQKVKFIGNSLFYKSLCDTITNNAEIIEVNCDYYTCFPYLIEFDNKHRMWVKESEIEPIEIDN